MATARRISDAIWRKKNQAKLREYHRIYRAKNRQRISQRSLAFYHSNKAKYKAYRKANKEKNAKYRMAYKARYPERYRESQHASWVRNRATLKAREKVSRAAITDGYIRHLLSKRGKIPDTYWPAPIIEAKRAQIKLQRTIKQLCQNQKT